MCFSERISRRLHPAGYSDQPVPDDRAGRPYVGRLEDYQKGEANILFVLGRLKKLQPNADYSYHLTLVGHSNGGDTADVFRPAASRPGHEEMVTLDNLACPS